MNSYVVKLNFTTDFYPPLTQAQRTQLHEKHLFGPLKNLSKEFGKDLMIVKELNLAGAAFVNATDEVAHLMQESGFIVKLDRIKKI